MYSPAPNNVVICNDKRVKILQDVKLKFESDLGEHLSLTLVQIGC